MEISDPIGHRGNRQIGGVRSTRGRAAIRLDLPTSRTLVTVDSPRAAGLAPPHLNLFLSEVPSNFQPSGQDRPTLPSGGRTPRCPLRGGHFRHSGAFRAPRDRLRSGYRLRLRVVSHLQHVPRGPLVLQVRAGVRRRRRRRGELALAAFRGETPPSRTVHSRHRSAGGSRLLNHTQGGTVGSDC